MTDDALDPLDIHGIALQIVALRGQRVILDADLAALYGVETKRLNEQIKRNASRFPVDFMFQLSEEEVPALRSQIATLKTGRGQHRKYRPYAFTEHGVIMAAMVLSSPRAVEVSVYVVRAFVQLREFAHSHRDLAQRLEALEETTQALAMQQDTFSRNTRNQLRQVFDTLRELADKAAVPESSATSRRPIGFLPLRTSSDPGNSEGTP